VLTRQQIAEIVEFLDYIQEIPNRRLTTDVDHIFNRIRQGLDEVLDEITEIDRQIYVAATRENNAINFAFRRKSSKKGKKSTRKGKKSMRKAKRSARK
jgi:phage-related protein